MNRRLFIPIVLCLTGLLLLTGCIYIPTFGVSIDGTSNLGRKIGNSHSTKSIRVGISTRAEVEKLFGPPIRSSDDGRLTAYRWKTRDGIFFLPICFWNEFGYLPDDRTRYFLLTYNSDHILARVEVMTQEDVRLRVPQWLGVPIKSTR